MYYSKEFCFICLMYDKNIKLFDTIDSKIQDILQYLVSRNILQNPDIPKYICEGCLETLRSIFNFRRKCMENIEIFYECVQKLTQEPNSCQCLTVALTHILNNKESKRFFNNSNTTESLNKELNFDTNIKNEISKSDDNESSDCNRSEEIYKDTEEIEHVQIKVEPPTDDFFDENQIEDICLDDYQNEVTEPVDQGLIEDFGVKKNINEKLIKDGGNSNRALPGHAATYDLKLFKCQSCQEKFGNYSELSDHKLHHCKKRRYACDICPKSFSQISNLKSHKRCHSGEKLHTCDVCQKTFTEFSNLKQHKRVHSDERPYACPVCPKTFKLPNNLKVHQRIHSGERPYVCQICQKSFIQICKLEKHKLIHSGEKPFTCDVCQRKFTYSETLRRHTLIHSGERPYKCEVCGKTFRQLCNLKTHRRIHSGEKPYECDVCQKKFSEPSNLNNHKRIHRAEKSYICDVCNKGFAQRNSFMRHKSSAHGGGSSQNSVNY